MNLRKVSYIQCNGMQDSPSSQYTSLPPLDDAIHLLSQSILDPEDSSLSFLAR
jgi:hypothetical protein